MHTPNDIAVLAEFVSEHPDDVLMEDIDVMVEMFWKRKSPDTMFDDPLHKALAAFIKPEHIKNLMHAHRLDYEAAVHQAMNDIIDEARSFIKKMPSMDQHDAFKAFIYYKQHNRLPPELERRGEQAVRDKHPRDFTGNVGGKGEQVRADTQRQARFR